MSRLSTRTKLALCAGLLAVAVGVAVVLVRLRERKPRLEVRFVCYTNWGSGFMSDPIILGAVLGVTNHGGATIRLFCDPTAALYGPRSAPVLLPGHCGTHVVAGPMQSSIPGVVYYLPTTISLRYWPVHSSLSLRTRVEAWLQYNRIVPVNTGAVVTVTLPPR